MQPRELSRGARRCLDRLRWYARRYGRVHPFQEKFAKRLGVSDRQVRTYLAELRAAGLVSVHQGGPGHPASYIVTSGLTSGELPGYFRAAPTIGHAEAAKYQQVAAENFRAEKPQLSSSGSSCSCSDQFECTVQERPEPAGAETEPSPFEKAQADAIADAVRACGFEPTPDLIAKLERKRRYYGVTGFVVASAIARAFKFVQGTSNEPDRQKPGWITVVAENALAGSKRPAGETPGTYGAKWMPTPHAPAIRNLPGPIPVSDVGQVDVAAVSTTRTAEPERGESEPAPAELGPQVNQAQQPAPPCPRCNNFGVQPLAADSDLFAWCDCIRGVERRAIEPGYIDAINRVIVKNRALIRPAAAVHPHPPRSERGRLRQVAIAAGGVR